MALDGSHTPGVVLPTSDCPRGWCCAPPGRGEGRGGPGRAGFARTLLRHRAGWLTPGVCCLRGHSRAPKLWNSISMHMNKLSPHVRIFKLVEQAGGEV